MKETLLDIYPTLQRTVRSESSNNPLEVAHLRPGRAKLQTQVCWSQESPLLTIIKVIVSANDDLRFEELSLHKASAPFHICRLSQQNMDI